MSVCWGRQGAEALGFSACHHHAACATLKTGCSFV